MILTVTLNPLLETRLFLKEIVSGTQHHALESRYLAGGKGINVSSQLNRLGILNQALTFAGGNAGKTFRQILTDEEIKHTFVSLNAEIRTAATIVETGKNKNTTVFAPNPVVSKHEADEFKSKMEKMIMNCSIVVFAGSSPCETTDDIFPFGISLANELDKISIVDTSGNTLTKCIEASPTVIHNNIEEIEQSENISLATEKSKIEFLKELYRKKIKLCYLTDGANPAYASKYDFVHKIKFERVDEIDSTGSGDAFVAGIAYGLEKALVFNEFVKVAAALGAANAASLEMCTSTIEDAQKYMNNICLEPIGKKMKLIDDSPTI